MPDMLVPLYRLPTLSILDNLPYQRENILIYRALAPNKDKVKSWVLENFSQNWASECSISFSRVPISCFLAVKEKTRDIIGFACYEATYPSFLGPMAVLEEYRGKGIGKGLLLHSLYGLSSLGYQYAIIGGAGPVGFYAETFNAIVIDDSVPGPYKNMI